MNQLVTLKLGVEKEYIEVDFPEITIASTGQKSNVIEASKFKGGMILTVRPHKTEDIGCEVIDNRNCVFDVKMIEQRLIELGALEDAEFEIIPEKQICNEK